MDDLENILIKISIPVEKINQDILQDVLRTTKQHGILLHDGMFIHIEQILFQHLEAGLNTFDDQLLCATCYYTILPLIDTNNDHLDKILNLLNEEIKLRHQRGKETRRTSLAVSLIYGIFQSAFITKIDIDKSPNIVPVLQASFKLLCGMAYEYSQYTFIVFKSLSLFKKVSGTILSESLFSTENQVKLLNVVNHNWENPVTGIRDLNKVIFQTLISTLKDKVFLTLLDEINYFYWNKAKYLMLAEIVSHPYVTNIGNMMQKTNWLEGLLSSLNKPGLVSAGTDMYFAIVKKLKSQKEWCQIFLNPIVDILKGKSKTAIKNFSNYWWLSTLKTYPALSTLLLEAVIVKPSDQTNTLANMRTVEDYLYAYLCILKPANKLGLICKNQNVNSDTSPLLLDALNHCNTHIRMMAFEILCVFQNKSMPTATDYELILTFLSNNMNSDCTVLRINMLNSFNWFLKQVNVLYFNCLRKSDEDFTNNLKVFCFKFQDCIIKCLELNGNYQRKTTCIKLVHTFLNVVNEVPGKKQMHTKTGDKTIAQLLKDSNQWILSSENSLTHFMKLLKDPADDIRENVAKLLLDHYDTQLKDVNVLNSLIEDALKSVKSKFFYDIGCGQCMFKLIVNLLLKEDAPEGLFKNVDDIFNFACKELISEYNLKTGVLESIEQGKQLHSFMSIMLAVLEVCCQNDCQINMTNESLLQLVNVLYGISNQFNIEEETTNSDFSKMNGIVKNIILASGYDCINKDDASKVSGLEKIVLMCLWLNVKAACELSSLLIKYQKDDLQGHICETALGTISNVLETCRHKGAIEAAGGALGQAIQHLTSLPVNIEISKLPFTFLKIKLNELIKEANKMASVTRRGAGLSIMVHRIVSSDMNRGKPLFHYFIKTILETCNRTEDIPSLVNADIDNEKDLPKAIYIHFLTRIVTDSKLASDVMFYSAELAELAFGNLANPHWQIRNAALQLYGALIQKLIGQKKISGEDEETVATVGCDELRTHSPKLWSDVLRKLENANCGDVVQSHSSLVPILNMLASLALRYNFSNEIFLQEDQTYEQLLAHLLPLVGSPIYSVRRLAAKSIHNIYPFKAILNYYKQDAFESENSLHGSLLLISNYKLGGSSEYLETIRKKYDEVFRNKKHSYLSKSIFEEIFGFGEPNIQRVVSTIAELRCNAHSPGVFLWANKRIQQYIKNAPWNIIPQILETVLSCEDSDIFCGYLLEKIDNTADIDSVVKIIETFLKFQRKFHSGLAWRILYQCLSLITQDFWRSEFPKALDITDTLQYLKSHEISYKLRFMLPFLARMSRFQLVSTEDLVHIARTIDPLTDPDIADVEMRYIAALAINQIAGCMDKYQNAGIHAVVPIVKSVIILLQDEDEDVRMLTAGFFSILRIHPLVLQPYICLTMILKGDFLIEIFQNMNQVEIFLEQLTNFISKQCRRNTNDEYNPFANSSSNIYLELNVLRKAIQLFHDEKSKYKSL